MNFNKQGKCLTCGRFAYTPRHSYCSKCWFKIKEKQDIQQQNLFREI